MLSTSTTSTSTGATENGANCEPLFFSLRALDKSEAPGDERKREGLRAHLLTAYDGLAANLHRTFCLNYRVSNPSDREDLLQEARFGLLRAIDKFDPEAGVKFTTYAYWLVSGAMLHFMRDSGFLRAPRNSDGPKMRVDCVGSMGLEGGYGDLLFDANGDSNFAESVDFAESVQMFMALYEQREQNFGDARRPEAIKLRFFENLTLTQIGERMKLPVKTVHDMIAASLEDLRFQMRAIAN